jgi:hypothetical protein|tara:strand:+ start:494 stop:757 length:264 start_codon:yes stop_codon:yes gene_type:complete
MVNLNKLKKAELIELLEKQPSLDKLKQETNVECNSMDEVIDYIKKLQDLNAERLKDCKDLLLLVDGYKKQIQQLQTDISGYINQAPR